MNLALRPVALVALILGFSRDLVLSSVQVARTVLGPGSPQPRFVIVPLDKARSDLEITMVANYITLTPGTLTVDVSANRRTLLIHSLLAGDSGDDVRADVRDGIEPRVTRVTQR